MVLRPGFRSMRLVHPSLSMRRALVCVAGVRATFRAVIKHVRSDFRGSYMVLRLCIMRLWMMTHCFGIEQLIRLFQHSQFLHHARLKRKNNIITSISAWPSSPHTAHSQSSSTNFKLLTLNFKLPDSDSPYYQFRLSQQPPIPQHVPSFYRIFILAEPYGRLLCLKYGQSMRSKIHAFFCGFFLKTNGFAGL